MVRKKFICKKCGYKFEVDVFEEGEAEEKGRPTRPVRCPKCDGSVEKSS
jgi:DNA-directed RNA polymerase subunit RPC12/RpoP